MEFAFTFGAIGDLVAVIELIKNIVIALDDCRGSAKEYQDVVHHLEILEMTLQQVAELYQDERFNSHLGDLRAIASRNLQQIRLCLDGFSDNIQKFAPSLANGGTKNVFKDMVMKIRWKLEEKDIHKLRAEVMGYTMSLNILLEVTTA